jgi:hypothetical protein
MTARSLRFKPYALLVAALVSAVLIKPVQDRLDTRIGQPRIVSDVLYFSSPQVIQKMALGYDGLIADIYWMRAIQYYGRRDEADRRRVRYGNLAKLLDITTTLDPDLLDAYFFGASFLAEPDPLGAGQPWEAIRLLDKGIGRHPSQWRLYFSKGFIYFWHLNNYQAAGEVWLEGARVPNAPPWMEGLAAMSLSKGGAVETARSLWQRQYQESDRADLKENAKNHLFSLQVDEQIWTLEFLLEKYRKKTGAFPTRLEALVRAGLLNYVPRDPYGAPYLYGSATGKVSLSPESKARYIKIPYDYRPAFESQLAETYGPN